MAQKSEITNVIILDNILHEWAKKRFKQRKEKCDDLRLCEFKDLKIHFIWDDIKISGPEKEENVTYTNKKLDKRKTLLLKTTFTNKTGEKEQHCIKTDRSVTEAEKVTITDGFKAGGAINIKLALPKQVLSVSGSAFVEHSLCHGLESSKSATMAWSTESTISVPEGSKVTAELYVEEEEFQSHFEAEVKIEGKIKVLFYKRGQLIYEDTEHIGKVFKEAGDIKAVISEDNETVKWNISGICYYRRGIDQYVNTEAEAATSNTS